MTDKKHFNTKLVIRFVDKGKLMLKEFKFFVNEN
jgi:hypothetical protein